MLFKKIRNCIFAFLGSGVSDKENWVDRWNIACKRCWTILSNGKPSVERFNRFKKHHNKLLMLCDLKIQELKNN